MHPTRQRLSGWSSNRLGRLDGCWKGSAFPDRRFTAGMIGIGAAERKLSPIALHGRIGFGTHPGGDPWSDCRPGAGSTGTEPAGAGGALYGQKQYFVSEASVYRLLKAQSYRQPGLHRHQTGRGIQRQAHGANQLWQTDFTYLKVTGGLVLSLHRAGRLLALHCRLEALRTMNALTSPPRSSGAGGFRARSDDRRSPTAALVGYGLILRRHGSRGVAGSAEHGARPQRPFITHRPRARSRWHQTLKNRTCLNTTTCPAISNARSPPSSSTTTMTAITRASTISLRPTFTSGALTPSSSNAKGSNARPSQIVACSTNCAPHNLNHPMIQSLPPASQRMPQII